ncbi:hypothetical protein DPEC_G00040240 [Dallia pectoralis]|uniref:Uncharacterized protein n=1 Tax=Dallia pectoralis TaxID=75939 RepID=A0ACC2HFI8_DALPE|nr:hypothetical protein DPEC_G00040240 [Dallia pectoralis]
MTALGELMLLVLGLLVTAHCEVRARDPEVEEEEPGPPVQKRGWNNQGMRVGVQFDIPHLRAGPHGYRPDLTAHQADGHRVQEQPSLGQLPEQTAPPPGEGGNYPARSGNWCAFVQSRIVSMAVACGMEKYTIKSQSPCPNGTPDCQLVMYKLSTRPVYREKQKIFTALLWRCCPGHGGVNCEETVAGVQVSDPVEPATAGQPHGDTEPQRTEPPSNHAHHPDWEQNDFQASEKPQYESYPSEADSNKTHAESSVPPVFPQQASEYIPHRGHDHPALPHYPQPNQRQQYFNYGDPVPQAEPQSPLPVPHIMALLMSQLQPVLDGFNRTLERLSREVGNLSQDVAQLRRSQWEAEALRGADAIEGPGVLESKIEESLQDIKEVRRELERQRFETANKLHTQQAMQDDFNDFKNDINMKTKGNHNMLQLNIQSMNAIVSDMKLEQERLREALQRDLTRQGDRREPSQALQPPDNSALWEAISNLDNKVVNNTVMVNSLVEDLEISNKHVIDLKRGFRDLGENITQTGRNSQIQFMETGLEVEAAKVAVLNRVNELASNLTIHSDQLQEIENDVDYLYTEFYKNFSAAGDCDCKAITHTISRLEQGLMNVTEVANDNRLALDGGYGADLERGGPSVEDIYQGLNNLKASLGVEQEKSMMLQRNVTQLLMSDQSTQRDVLSLQESSKRLEIEMRHLSSSFNSLLKDAIRHNDVLETLLGEEVMGFMDWPMLDQEAYSIPALQERLRSMQEQIQGQHLSLTSLLQAAQAEDTASDEPSVLVDWASRGLERSGHWRNTQLKDAAGSEGQPDFPDSDLWSLEKAVEELGEKVSRLEDRPCPTSCNSTGGSTSDGAEAKLQLEVARLSRGLEDHLQLFRNVFSNPEGLAGSASTLDLDQLWTMLKKESRRQKKTKDKKDRANPRSKRETSVLSQQGDSPLMFLASSLQLSSPSKSRQPDSRPIVFQKTSINRSQAYSTGTGTFRAPLAGVYLFAVTLNFEPGPSLAGLRRESGEAVATLHQAKTLLSGPVTHVCLLEMRQGEKLYLELFEGTLATDDRENIFAGLLMHHTT